MSAMILWFSGWAAGMACGARLSRGAPAPDGTDFWLGIGSIMLALAALTVELVGGGNG